MYSPSTVCVRESQLSVLEKLCGLREIIQIDLAALRLVY